MSGASPEDFTGASALFFPFYHSSCLLENPPCWTIFHLQHHLIFELADILYTRLHFLRLKLGFLASGYARSLIYLHTFCCCLFWTHSKKIKKYASEMHLWLNEWALCVHTSQNMNLSEGGGGRKEFWVLKECKEVEFGRSDDRNWNGPHTPLYKNQ